MSRTELAAAVNEYVRARTGRAGGLRGAEVGRYERGDVRWPSKAYREALRAILKAGSDEELGFYPTPRGPLRQEAQVRPAWLSGRIVARALVRRADQILVVRPPRASWFGLPGGPVDARRSVLSALAQQVTEQTGLDVTIAGVAGGLEHPAEAGGHRMLTLVFEAQATIEAGELSLRPEVKWLVATDLVNHDLRPAVLKEALLEGADGTFWRAWTT